MMKWYDGMNGCASTSARDWIVRKSHIGDDPAFSSAKTENIPSTHLTFSFSCLFHSQQTLHLLFLQSLNPHQCPSWSWSRQKMGEAESQSRMESKRALPPPLPWNSWRQQAKQSLSSWSGDGTRWKRQEKGFETVRWASGEVNDDLDRPADSRTNAEGEG